MVPKCLDGIPSPAAPRWRCARLHHVLLTASMLLWASRCLPVHGQGLAEETQYLRGMDFICEGDWRLVVDEQAPQRLYNKSQCTQGLLGTGYGDVLLDLAPHTGMAETQAADSSTGCMIHVSAETQATRLLVFQYQGTAEEVPLTKVTAKTTLGASIHASFSSTETEWAMGWGLQVKIPELALDHVHTAVGAWSIAPSTHHAPPRAPGPPAARTRGLRSPLTDRAKHLRPVLRQLDFA
jgi:hypothetical protein